MDQFWLKVTNNKNLFTIKKLSQRTRRNVLRAVWREIFHVRFVWEASLTKKSVDSTKDRKLRLEDAINATKAAVEEGIVPGGGATLTHISKDLEYWSKENLSDEELIGALIVEKSLTYPLRRIIENTGVNPAVIIEEIKNSDFNIGYNASTDVIVDMYEEGIIDPAKVTRSALQNAASIASMILTTECIVVDKQ